MSKLNVNELEANGTNSNLKVVSNGTTGVCEVKGATNDGTLQLNCSAQSHGVKLKAPADSAGQNYTIALPDNQIAASKFLKVKSVVGSGSTGEGQLEFSDVPSGIYPNLNADNITTGTLPTARVGAFTPSGGAGLKLISTATVATGTSAAQIDFTGLDDNSVYLIQAKETNFDTTDQMIRVYFLDASGNAYTSDISFVEKRGVYSSQIDYAANTSYGYFRAGASNTRKYQFTMHLVTTSGYVFGWIRGQNIDRSNYSQGNFADPFMTNIGFNLSAAVNSTQLHGIRFTGGSRNFVPDTTIHLYKYMET